MAGSDLSTNEVVFCQILGASFHLTGVGAKASECQTRFVDNGVLPTTRIDRDERSNEQIMSLKQFRYMILCSTSKYSLGSHHTSQRDHIRVRLRYPRRNYFRSPYDHPGPFYPYYPDYYTPLLSLKIMCDARKRKVHLNKTKVSKLVCHCHNKIKQTPMSIIAPHSQAQCIIYPFNIT
jgi:hypothetical protein